MVTPKRPVLRYHGGKWKLAQWIISNFPPHRVYVEPYGGGGSVLLRKPRSYAEVYNDKWDVVVNVFRVLRDKQMSSDLETALRLTPFARSEFDKCGDEELSTVSDPVERARRTILRSFAGYGSASTNAKHSTGFRSNVTRLWKVPAHDWAGYPDHIKEFTERMQGVVIENREAIEVIKRYDSDQTLFYIDPPYPHMARNMKRGNAYYAQEMSDGDHRELADLLHSVNGNVVLSGYRNDLYDSLFSDWKSVERKTFADGARPRTEVLWFSPGALTPSLL